MDLPTAPAAMVTAVRGAAKTIASSVSKAWRRRSSADSELIELVGHDTGNMWLDISWEYSWEDYPWEEAAMEYLKMEWLKAQRILAQIDPLLNQMDKHPLYWLKRLAKLWNSAIKTAGTIRPQQ